MATEAQIEANRRNARKSTGLSVTVWESITFTARWASGRNERVSAKWLPPLAESRFFREFA